MPIKVYCPDCDVPIKAPTSTAGTRIDCPDCGARVCVPQADSGAWGTRDPWPRRSADRDDRDDRPWKAGKKKGGKKKKGPSRGLLIGLIVGGSVFLLAVLVGGGIIAYRMMQPDADKTIAGEGWYKADDPDGAFTAYFPGDKPKYEKHGFQPSAFLASKAGRKAEELGFSAKTWTRRDGGREYSISLLTLPGDGSSDAAERAAAQVRTPPGPGVTVALDDTVSLGNRQARRLVIRNGNKGQASLFLGIGGRQFLAVVVSGDGSVDQNDSKVKAFFDNLTVTG
jgi:hypothetical protein